jgi:hypothetical protein
MRMKGFCVSPFPTPGSPMRKVSYRGKD